MFVTHTQVELSQQAAEEDAAPPCSRALASMCVLCLMHPLSRKSWNDGRCIRNIRVWP